MTGPWWKWNLVGLCLAWPLVTATTAADPAGIANRRRSQQSTIEAARQLVAGVLDIQLRQLRENGLEGLAVYGEIRAMRANLEHVAATEMQQVIGLLAKAEDARGAEQDQYLQQARKEARATAVVLMAERERLRRRLKVAQVTAQLRQLVSVQASTRTRTAEISSLPTDKRERETLAAFEDQRDAHVLYEQLLHSLDTVSQWESNESRAAAGSLAALRKADLERHFQSAEALLGSGASDQAVRDQGQILQELDKVLARMEVSQGVDQADSRALLEQVVQLLDDQSQVRDETRATEDGDQNRLDQLSDRQHEIRQKLADLRVPAGSRPGATSSTAHQGTPVEQTDNGQTALEKARAAAEEAESQLFEGRRREAIGHQEDVVRHLDQLRQRLESNQQDGSGENAREQLAAEIQQLEQLDEALANLDRDEAEVIDRAADEPVEAEERQQRVAADLNQEAQRQPLPDAVKNGVQEAADESQNAATAMDDHAPESAKVRLAAARQAQQALGKARTEVSSQLAAARRRQGVATAQQLAHAVTQSGKAGSQQRPQAASASSANDQPTQNASARAQRGRRTAGEAGRSLADGQDIHGRSFGDAPWFARLPPELREAIRARVRNRAPRGYEERLRRYFESVDRSPGK